MVEHFKRVSAHAFFNPFLCGNYAILIATFNQFEMLWYHCCDLQLKERGKFKSFVNIINHLPCPIWVGKY